MILGVMTLCGSVRFCVCITACMAICVCMPPPRVCVALCMTQRCELVKLESDLRHDPDVILLGNKELPGQPREEVATARKTSSP